MRALSPLFFLLTTAALACGTTVVVIEGDDDGGGGDGATGSATGPGSSAATTTTGGGGAMVGSTSSVTTTGAGGMCADQVFAAEPAPRPVDLVVAYGGFQVPEALDALEQQLHPVVVSFLEGKGHDVRTIAVGGHGISSGDACFQPPLAAPTNCAGSPGIVAGEFYHYSLPFVSGNGVLCALLEGINAAEPDEYALAPQGFSSWLRTEAVKGVIAVADANVACSIPSSVFLQDQGTEAGGKAAATLWDDHWLASAPGQLGTKAKRNYVFHALNRIPSPPNGFTWEFGAPFQLTGCGGFPQPGPGYQALAIGTEGRRGSLCAGANYIAQLSEIAAAISLRATDRCRLAVPAGEDPSLLVVELDPSNPNLPSASWTPVPTSGDCAAAGDGFYFVNDEIVLCPDSCAAVEADPAATLNVVSLCPTPI